MAYESTEVAVSKSQDAIRKLVYSHRGTGVMLISRPPREGFEAFVTISDVDYHVRIMATCKDVSRNSQGYIRTASSHAAARGQEERRVWRVLYWHLKAIFEAADSGVIDLRDVILPYVVTRDGRTISEHLAPRMPQLMGLDPDRLLAEASE